VKRLESDPEEAKQIDEALSRAATPTQRTEDNAPDVENSQTRPVSPNSNPVVSGLSPEDEKLPPTEELEIYRGYQFPINTGLIKRHVKLQELPSLPDNRWHDK
jgi:hypothetical protein